MMFTSDFRIPTLCAPIMLLMIFCLASPAHAELRICNKKSRSSINAALALLSPNQNIDRMRGWFIIKPKKCKTVLDYDLRLIQQEGAELLYYFLGWGKDKNPGSYKRLCVDRRYEFTWGTRTKCDRTGYRKAWFKKINIRNRKTITIYIE